MFYTTAFGASYSILLPWSRRDRALVMRSRWGVSCAPPSHPTMHGIGIGISHTNRHTCRSYGRGPSMACRPRRPGLAPCTRPSIENAHISDHIDARGTRKTISSPDLKPINRKFHKRRKRKRPHTSRPHTSHFALRILPHPMLKCILF